MARFAFPFLVFLLLVSVYSCHDRSEEQMSRELKVDPATVQSPFQLGRILFYDRNLSVNGSVSCSSCHKQSFAFSDDKAFSVGFENKLTSRNSPPIQNLSNGSLSLDGGNCGDFFGNVNCDGGRVIGKLFWDGRQSSLHEMVLEPILNHREMGIKSTTAMVERLKKFEHYEVMFEEVYGTADFGPGLVADALANFIGGITSFNTKFDQSQQGLVELSALERQGFELFFEKYQCNSCHQVQSPVGYQFSEGGSFLNIGLDPVYEDTGVMDVTGESKDAGKFKTPSLRNVELTAPYMHDGRFETLEEVIEHYSNGISQNPNLDFRLKGDDGNPLVLEITPLETRAIVAFMRTLTDQTMISDPSLSDPFTQR
jgi:cytochrome c peroxidase